MSLQGGRLGAFEVTVDGALVHSKLDSGDWPDTERILAEVAKRIAG